MIKIFKKWDGSYIVYDDESPKSVDSVDNVKFEDGEDFHIALIPVRVPYKESDGK